MEINTFEFSRQEASLNVSMECMLGARSPQVYQGWFRDCHRGLLLKSFVLLDKVCTNLFGRIIMFTNFSPK